jgi:hypothetical protein
LIICALFAIRATCNQVKLCVVDNADAGGNLDALWWPCASTKVSSRCSKDKLVRAPFLNHYALMNDKSRGKFTVSIYDDHFPRADAGAHAGGGG